VTVSVTVANVGEVEGSYTVVLRIDGEAQDGLNVTLGANASTVIYFTVVGGEPGGYAVGVEGLTTSFNVLRPAEFEVSSLSIDPYVAEDGGEVTVSVSVCNIGEEEGSHTVELRLDGALTDERTLTLACGADTTVSFSVLTGVGTHAVEVGSLTGSFTVTAPAGPEPDDGASQPSFQWTYAIAVGAVALVAIGMIARRFMK